jgi:DNA-binding transcriptional regulator YdaS (Cro superfamily)
MKPKTCKSAIKKACQIVGGQTALARTILVAPPTVNQWIVGKRPISARLAVAIEGATSGKVSRKDLRPNDFHLIWPEMVKEVEHHE